MNDNRLYRCIDAARWEGGSEFAHLPKLASPFPSGRWNDLWQFAVYTSHSPDTALAEKRRHLLDATNPSTVAGSLVAARTTATASKRVVVVTLDLPATHVECFDVRGLGEHRVNRCLERCSYAPALDVFRWKVRLEGFVRLFVPSSPVPASMNSVLYYMGWRQPTVADLPPRAVVVASDPDWIEPEDVAPCP